MLQFLMHHVGRTDLTGIRNCHVEGLHSIMLHDADGNRVRMYVANNANTHSNYIRTNRDIIIGMDYDDEDSIDILEMDESRHDEGYGMTLGLHSHHCEVRLEVLTGTLYNITAEIEPHSNGFLREYEYVSPITGVGRVSDSGRRWCVSNSTPTAMTQEASVILGTDVLHTVHAEGFTSWLVYERGESESTPVSSFYSYNPRVPSSPEPHMYQPMDSAECQALIARVIGQYNGELERALAAKAMEAEARESVENLAAVREAMDQGAALLDMEAPRSSAQSRLFKAACNYSANVANQWAAERLTNEDWQEWVAVVRSPQRRSLPKAEFAAWRMPRLLAQTRSARAASTRSVVGARPGVAMLEEYQQQVAASMAQSIAEIPNEFLRAYTNPVRPS